jgi:hypothetical protein
LLKIFTIEEKTSFKPALGGGKGLADCLGVLQGRRLARVLDRERAIS